MKGQDKNVCYYCYKEFFCDPKEKQDFRNRQRQIYEDFKKQGKRYRRENFACPTCLTQSYEERLAKKELVLSKGVKSLCGNCYKEFTSYTGDCLEICPDCKKSYEILGKERQERISRSPIIVREFVCSGCGKEHKVEIPTDAWMEFKPRIIFDLHGFTKLPLSNDPSNKGYEIMKQMCPACITKKYYNKEHNWCIDHKPADYFENHDTYYYRSKFVTTPSVYPKGEPRKNSLMD